MLSAESASGQYPIEAVSMMNKVAMAVETDVNYRGIIRAQAAEPEATAADAISAATRQVAETLDLAAIVTYTSSGSTGIRAARERPSKPIIALSPNLRTTRRLSVVWGIHCIQTEDAVNLEDMVDRACVIAYQEGFARPGDRIAITAGIPLGTPGRDQHAAHRLCAAGRGRVVVDEFASAPHPSTTASSPRRRGSCCSASAGAAADDPRLRRE